MKAQTREIHARTMRVGFEPSETLKKAVSRFGKQRHSSEVVAQTTAFRAIDLADGEARQSFEREATVTARSLRGLGRSALALSSGLEIQPLPQSMRLFFTPEDPGQLKNVIRRMETMTTGEMYDRPESALFIDIARTSLRHTNDEDIQRAVDMLTEAMADPDERRGLVLRSPHLVFRDIDRFPRRDQRAA